MQVHWHSLGFDLFKMFFQVQELHGLSLWLRRLSLEQYLKVRVLAKSVLGCWKILQYCLVIKALFMNLYFLNSNPPSDLGQIQLSQTNKTSAKDYHKYFCVIHTFLILQKYQATQIQLNRRVRQPSKNSQLCTYSNHRRVIYLYIYIYIYIIAKAKRKWIPTIKEVLTHII